MSNHILAKDYNTQLLGEPTQRSELGIDHLTMDELMRSNKALEQFAFEASHDLQEPLRTVYSYVQLLDQQYRGKLDDKADKIIYAILESNERMQKLIQSLLKYSRAGEGSVQLKELDCSIPLSRAIENLKAIVEENFVQIECEVSPVSINGDEIQLTQLFQNLINNAIKFSKKNETPHIYITAREKYNQWCFSIQDHGIGIEPEYTRSIFGLFKRLHSQREYAGSGIGLALCKRIIESHQGDIWIESEIGKGTTVYFTIPKISGNEPSKNREQVYLLNNNSLS